MPKMGPAGDSGATSFSVVKGNSLELALVRHEPAELEWLADQMREGDRALEELRFDVGRVILGISSRRQGRDRA